MKFWSAMFVVFALCFAGFVSTAHAGLNPDHSLHDASIQHECQQAAKKSEPASTSIDKAFCEIACHAGAMVNVTAGSLPEHGAIADNGKITSADEAIASNTSATPDQPPRLS